MSAACTLVAKSAKKSDCTATLTEEICQDDETDEVEVYFNDMQSATDPDKYFKCSIDANTDLAKNVDAIHLWNGIRDINLSEYLRAALGNNNNCTEIHDNFC